jgi:hypothetical protein
MFVARWGRGTSAGSFGCSPVDPCCSAWLPVPVIIGKPCGAYRVNGAARTPDRALAGYRPPRRLADRASSFCKSINADADPDFYHTIMSYIRVAEYSSVGRKMGRCYIDVLRCSRR